MTNAPDDEEITLYEIRVKDEAGNWRTWPMMMIRANAELIFKRREWEIVPGSGVIHPAFRKESP